MITRNPPMTALLKWPNYNQLARCSHSVNIKPGLVEMSPKLKTIEFAGKVKTDQRVKS